MMSEEAESRDIPSETLTPSGLGQYIGYSGCPRFFRLKFFDRDIVNERDWYDHNTHTNLFAELGLAFEEQQLESIAAEAELLVGDEQNDGNVISFDQTWETPPEDKDENIADEWKHCVRNQLAEIVEDVASKEPSTTDGPVVLFQTPMHGQIGVWDISGIADLIVLTPITDEYGVQSYVLEIKTSWKEKTSHQIQSTIYTHLLNNLINELDIEHRQTASVINREHDLEETSFDELPKIDLPSRSAEIKRLLRRDGELHQLEKQSFEDVGYRLERKCDNCPYNGVCFTKAIEDGDPALLSLTQGNQEQLKEYNIDSLQELSELLEREEETVPYDYDQLEVRNEEVVRSLETKGTLANRLDEIVQRAQLLRGEIDPQYDRFDNVEYLRGVGNGILPDDDPPDKLPGVSGKRDELIRVYLYIQHDHVRDRLALIAGRIDSNQTETQQIIELSESLPTGQDESLNAESDLLGNFFRGLFKSIREVQSEIDEGSKGYVHLYTYSKHERDVLMEAVKRQPSVFGSSAVRDLLGLREGIDQPMVSVVHNDITNRLALRYPGTGLIQTVDQMEAYVGGSYNRRHFSHDDWEAEIDGTTVDLKSIFKTGLFEGKRAYVEQGDSIRLLLDDGNDPETEPDGFYPVYNRFGNQIPLEYIWAAKGKLDDIGYKTSTPDFNTYRYYNSENSESIGEPEIKALTQRLTEALQHVERSIQIKNWKIEKNPIDTDQLPEVLPNEMELSIACQEYLDLEHATERQECLEHYIMPPRKRMQSGDSTIFRVTDVTDNGDWEIHVEGELLYDELFRDPDRVIDSCRISGKEQGGSGSWRVMSKLERDGNRFSYMNVYYPNQIKHSVHATVKWFNRVDKTISVSASTHGGFGHKRYVESHSDATKQPEEAEDSDYTVLIQEGDLFILDPFSDSYTKTYAYQALERTDSNALYRQFNQAFHNGKCDQFNQRFCPEEAVDEFLTALESTTGMSPRGRQENFVKSVNKSVCVLQGPPGTGKTSFTLSPSILAR